MLGLNDKAPDFSLPGSDGKEHTLKEFSGRYLVLYFYPKDDTPGCTIEAKAFSKELQRIRKLGAEVVGISKDDFDSHCRFRDKYVLSLLLLSDTDSKAIKAYGAYGDRGIFGFGTLRKTYIIDKKGKIAKIFPKVQPLGHEKEVLEFLSSVKD
ncbi:MAG: peroxiredoxin [Candidatus Micrarchaeota archaeon]|nr:peroxiredoxin [Candidatus Micrarchaeota archaeon]MDE1849891.1 peroxiredoxin [Candidatus Micrarchaeota archaeon]